MSFETMEKKVRGFQAETMMAGPGEEAGPRRTPVSDSPNAQVPPIRIASFLTPEQEADFKRAVKEGVTEAVLEKANEVLRDAPLTNGTWKRRLQLGGIAAAGVVAGVTATIAVRKFRNRKGPMAVPVAVVNQ